MFDQAFTKRNLARQIRKSDFITHKDLIKEDIKKSLISDAVDFSETSLFSPNDFKTKKVKGKPVYFLDQLHKELVLRKATENIQRTYKKKQSDRDIIVKQISSLVKEGIAYKLYKLDIMSFYESINRDYLLDKIDSEPSINYRTKLLVDNFVTQFNKSGNTGLPRGMSISATLSEIFLSDFDSYIKSHEHVFYYARFVDDIIIITSSKEGKGFENEIKQQLPKGLKLNSTKSKKKVISLNTAKKEDSYKVKKKVRYQFEYLGYHFSILPPPIKNNPHCFRGLNIDIAESKQKKIKTRIIKSFVYYYKFGDFNLLLDRIKLLTSNFSLLDKKKNIQVMSGLYYNYKRIDIDSSESIRALDKTLKYYTHTNPKICKGINHSLTKIQKRKLASYSFELGFRNRKRVYFTPTRQSKLQRTWRDDK
ncbi:MULTISPECIES: antiviral reverse transcriptase Drt3a [Pseudomonadati]|uniref:Antiviral reverse transcriptase Drt3a n=1 Tax=Vibrio cyclitrophicus ZF270 TaxID=1136176 RepID=A0AAN0LR94_9VIBR|nr:antiviral reverse transcriptase Drt3a [Vibrio cyclitrophicus]MBU2933298.1 RNA-directed DNA polymerase [Vibrio cyclitrophicus]OBS94970.1 hypothetical protein A9259_12620 [Vibrio cyclitrophicus]OEE06040.1 hypothetical protein OAO_01485 [Vibrio cyclitrophicus ZF28]OEE06577.1 hypothetical protein OC7_03105 [Vibrio cyclitrophicus ZF270]PMH38556.1 hypothetical protein BCU69_03320 [Vibrio cyclitrophicus]